jgi:NAD(P)-dependent dehydrogenase (short-subunit alcohol dehydrogenase family)
LFSVFEATSDEIARATFETNFFGALNVMRSAIPLMREAGGGRIVILTSASAIVVEPLMAIYTASKAALDSFTAAVQFELAPLNIAVKIIEPGLVTTTKLVEKVGVFAATVPVPKAYEGYYKQRATAFASPPAMQLATAEDVADAIVAASIDETGKLRWVVGRDVEESAHMRWETTDVTFEAWMQRKFAPIHAA